MRSFFEAIKSIRNIAYKNSVVKRTGKEVAHCELKDYRLIVVFIWSSLLGLHVSVRVYTKIIEETQVEKGRQFEWRKQENEGGKVVEDITAPQHPK